MPPNLQENRRLVRRYFDLLNTNDLSGLEEILSPDVVFFGPRAPEGIYGREAFIEFIAALGRELPDLRFAEGEMVAEGSRVASVFTMTSTHSSEEGRAKGSRRRVWICFISRMGESSRSMPTSTG